MTKLRRERSDDNQHQYFQPLSKPLRIVASGTLFQTHTLSIPCHPLPSTVIRAHSVEKARGGSANMLLSLLAQFPAVEAVLVAPLGGNEEGRMVLKDLENERVITKYCKIWRDAGVPSAWVLHSEEDKTKTVVNHNPLPDITHEDFVSLLGPLLAPENYPQPPPTPTSTTPNYESSSSLAPLSTATPRPSQSGPRPQINPVFFNPNSPAPFDWLHFEGRSVKTTLSNITGLDGLARERKWRSHCVFSVDVGRKGKQGVEALIPHADVLFFNKHYAEANSPHYETTPRAFLLSLASTAPPHALLVAYWGTEGGAVLSLPTREYFQSSGWVEERPTQSRQTDNNGNGIPFSGNVTEVQSVRSGSQFWADGRSGTPSSRAFTGGGSHYLSDTGDESEKGQRRRRLRTHMRQGQGTNESSQYTTAEDDDNDSQGTETPGGDQQDLDDSVVDEVGAQDAFIAGMIFALSRRLCPGLPYTPSWSGEDASASSEDGRGRWKLDECLRFGTELSGRKARRQGWGGLAHEMVQAGWFEGS